MARLKSNPCQRPSRFNLAVGRQIRDVSTCLRVSSRQLSLRSGIRLDHLELYQSGLRPPTCRALQRIGQALGIPVDPLLPQIELSDPVNQDLYLAYRGVWFLPAETKRVLTRIVEYFVQTPGLTASLVQASTTSGGHHAHRA